MVDYNTSISWESVYKISHSWVDVLIFMYFYLESCIWPDAIYDWSASECTSNLLPMSEKVWWRPWQWSDKHSGKKAWVVQTEKGEEQSQELANNFPWHQENCLQRIRTGSPNSQFCIILWRVMAMAWRHLNTSPRTLAPKQLAVA
jgi:hypothetical protein